MKEKLLLVDSLESKITYNRTHGLSNLLKEDQVIEEKLFKIMEDIFLSENISKDLLDLGKRIRNNKLTRFEIDIETMNRFLSLKENSMLFLKEQLSESQSFRNNFYVESMKEIEETEKRIVEVERDLSRVKNLKESTELFLEEVSWTIFKKYFMCWERSIN